MSGLSPCLCLEGIANAQRSSRVKGTSVCCMTALAPERSNKIAQRSGNKWAETSPGSFHGAGDRYLQPQEWGLCPGLWRSSEVARPHQEMHQGDFPAPAKKPVVCGWSKNRELLDGKGLARLRPRGQHCLPKCAKIQGPSLVFQAHHITLSDSLVTLRRGPGPNSD